MSLRTATLEIARDLPKGDPTRRKILAALKEARGGTLSEYQERCYNAFLRDTAEVIARMIGAKADTGELNSGFMNIYNVPVVRIDGTPGRLDIRELWLSEDDGYTDGDSQVVYEEDGRTRYQGVGGEYTGKSIHMETPPQVAKKFLDIFRADLAKKGWSLAK